MLVVKVEVHPGGDASRAHVIEELFVWNVSQLADVSDYLFSYKDPRLDANWSAGRIIGHRRSDGPWALLQKVLGGL